MTTYQMIKCRNVRLEDLNSEEVMNAAKYGTLMIVTQDVTDEEKEYCKVITRLAQRCKQYYAEGCNIWNVHEYIGELMRADITPFRKRMRREKGKCRFVCNLMGEMLELGIFQATPLDLVKALGFTHPDIASIARYIYQGQEKVKSERKKQEESF